MKPFIDVRHVSLAYTLGQKLSLRPRSRTATGGNLRTARGRSYVQALDDVSFHLTEGDRLGRVGTNGAGQSTLLKVLYGIMEPTSGTIETQGRIDALFNINLGFRKEASGRRNIELRGLINGWSKAQIDARMDEIIEFSELGEFIDVPYKTYSQGMAARLAFSVATALEPEILLMDEWIGAGDAKFRAKAAKRMNQVAEKAGIIVLASHDKKLIKRVCNKVLFLEKGQVKDLIPIELYE